MSDKVNICGLEAGRGQKSRTFLSVPGTACHMPVTIINGQGDGPTLLITAGIHGGEYPGIAAAIELARDLEPQNISVCLIIIHPVNTPSFWARSAFIVPEDGKNLNREFPGAAGGTLSQKIAHVLSQKFFPQADFYIDLHSGDIHEELYPYVYYPGLPNEETAAAARSVAQVLDVEYMVRSTATSGAYNYAAISGLPSLLIERGGAGLCLREDIEAYKKDILNIMRQLALLPEPPQPRRHTPRDLTNVIYLENTDQGCWLPNFRSGAKITKGDRLGILTDLFGSTIATYQAEQDGIILYQCASLAVPAGNVLLAYGKPAE